MRVDGLGAVIVHHNSLHTIADAVAAIHSGGVPLEAIVVVDNSDDAAVGARLRSMIDPTVLVVCCANDGYAAAVNFGARVLREHSPTSTYALIATHEAKPSTDALARLVTALDADRALAAVGPTLVTDDTDGRPLVWSEGGYLSRRLRLPRHHGHGSFVLSSETSPQVPVRRDWLDGAFVVYRLDDLTDSPLREDYFLYMEEVDYHLTLAESGSAVAWVPGAVAWQSSGGIPDYYLTRNMYLFQLRHGTSFSRWAAVPYEIARRTASSALGRGKATSSAALLSGWRAGRRASRAARRKAAPGVVVVNPIGKALHHYTEALAGELAGAGLNVTTRSIDEPSASGQGRLGWLLSGYRTVLAERKTGERILVTWPPVGFLDLVVLRAVGGRSVTLVIHDPVPLVRSVGYGRLSRVLARRFPRVGVLVHSREAADEVARAIRVEPQQIRHPMLWTGITSDSFESASDAPVVLVFGQYKPDRDLDLMTALGKVAGSEFDLRVIGRGWPQVAGWTVTDAFVPEDEVDTLLASAAVVLIPYRRYFQSGVAFRAIEVGTPVVGQGSPSLTDLLGAGSPLLVNSGAPVEAWLSALRSAVREGRQLVRTRRTVLHDESAHAWAEWSTRSSV